MHNPGICAIVNTSIICDLGYTAYEQKGIYWLVYGIRLLRNKREIIIIRTVNCLIAVKLY